MIRKLKGNLKLYPRFTKDGLVYNYNDATRKVAHEVTQEILAMTDKAVGIISRGGSVNDLAEQLTGIQMDQPGFVVVMHVDDTDCWCVLVREEKPHPDDVHDQLTDHPAHRMANGKVDPLDPFVAMARNKKGKDGSQGKS